MPETPKDHIPGEMPPVENHERSARGKVVPLRGNAENADISAEKPPKQEESTPMPSQPAQQQVPTDPAANAPQIIIAAGIILAVVYFGKLIFITLATAVLLAFVLAPISGWMERRRAPRSVAAGISVALLIGVLYVGSYFFYVKAVEFAQNLPKYSSKFKGSILKVRKQAEQIQSTKDSIMPDSEKDAVKVRQVEDGWMSPQSTTMETLLAISFIPFLIYFMITWQDHVRASIVRLFAPNSRTTAYVAISHMSQMLRSFIVGNAIIGLIMSLASALIFWWVGVPYFYFVGLLSGFLSLVPYLGLLLAMAPPIAAGLGELKSGEYIIVAAAVLVIHLFGLNVLYPKILGRRLQLNPLVVTVAVLVFGFLWGGMGLVLALPILGAIKIACEHIDGLQALGELMGEGTDA